MGGCLDADPGKRLVSSKAVCILSRKDKRAAKNPGRMRGIGMEKLLAG
jgi:hypothetical protein